ncbi:MAG: hypothetical protein ACC618_04420 [Patescibacteria group bacterium]
MRCPLGLSHWEEVMLMIKFNKKEMEEKLKVAMEFIKVPDDEQERIQYAEIQKTGKDS